MLVLRYNKKQTKLKDTLNPQLRRKKSIENQVCHQEEKSCLILEFKIKSALNYYGNPTKRSLP